MGTDIHLQVQGKNSDGKWEWIKRPPFKAWSVDRDDFDFDADPTCRNYSLFAILAGVRNGYGFAGTYRHEPVTPWFEGRGLPDGMTNKDCERVDDSVPAYGDDRIGDHSFTHATLAELRAAPWGHEFHRVGSGKWSPLTDCAFRKWIDGDVMQSIADEYGGPERVRVLMGFDS